MSLDTVLGAIFDEDQELELGRGLALRRPLKAALNPDTGLIDLTLFGLDGSTALDVLLASSNTARTLTSVSRAEIGADLITLPAGVFVSGSSRIRIKAWGVAPATATHLGVDLFNVGPGVKPLDDTLLSSTLGGTFEYECNIYPLTATSQNVRSSGALHHASPSLVVTATTADLTLAQIVRLVGLSSSGAITVGRVEVWATVS